MRGEYIAVGERGVAKGGFAVVGVRDNGDVTYLGCHGLLTPPEERQETTTLFIVVFVFGIFIVEGAITLRDRGIFVFFGLTRRTRVSRS